MRKVRKYLFHPIRIFRVLMNKFLCRFGWWISDSTFLKILFHINMGEKLDLKNPKTFNQKLQWLKLYDRNPRYITMVDKCEVKEYVAKVIGAEYIIPTIGVWQNPEEINFDSLPERFVLKCNHNSGLGMTICKDKAGLDIKKTKALLKKGLKQSYFKNNREWPYKDVKRRIIAEQYIEDEAHSDLKDFKFMCFNGEVKCCFVCTRRFEKEGLHVTFYDRDWHKMPFQRLYPSETIEIDKPINYEKMIELAEQLSKDIPFVRVDFYEVNGKIYFGELTFFPGSGMEPFTPYEWDLRMGEWLKLPRK